MEIILQWNNFQSKAISAIVQLLLNYKSLKLLITLKLNKVNNWELQNAIGIEYIARLQESVEDKKDLWLIYELCEGKNLNDSLFEVKGEFFKGERIYMVHHSDFYHSLRNSHSLIKDLIFKISSALNFFASHGIIHADLKPDNILVDVDEENM